MKKFEAPVSQYTTAERWAVAKQQGVSDAYRFLHDGRHVGWLTITPEGWHWQSDDVRRPTISKRAFPTWEAAAAGLVKTSFARMVAGGVVKPSEWRPVGWIRPWAPKPAKQS